MRNNVKTLISVIILLVSASYACAQDTIVIKETGELPKYTGESIAKDMTEALEMPEYCMKNFSSGKVVLTFNVDTTGHITDTEVIKSVDPYADAAAVKALKSLKSWIPGTYNGKKYAYTMKYPINFSNAKQYKPRKTKQISYKDITLKYPKKWRNKSDSIKIYLSTKMFGTGSFLIMRKMERYETLKGIVLNLKENGFIFSDIINQISVNNYNAISINGKFNMKNLERITSPYLACAIQVNSKHHRYFIIACYFKDKEYKSRRDISFILESLKIDD